jgi:hypothetical protein
MRLGDLFELDITWVELCAILPLNEWALNEGLANEDSNIELTPEQLKELIKSA